MTGKRFGGFAVATMGLVAAMIGTAGLAGAVGTTSTTATSSTTVKHSTTTVSKSPTTEGRGSVTPAVKAPTQATPAAPLAPPGNNGTIKIDGTPFSNANHPHVTCSFTLAFYGFDVGNQTAVVTFTAQPPSGSFTPVAPTEGPSAFTFTGHGPGSSFDASRTYELNVSGLTAQAQQGYHIKVSVDVTGAQGADDKSKVFWYEPCVVPPTTTTTVHGTTTTTVHGTTTTTAHGTTTTTAAATGGTTTTEPLAAASAAGSSGVASSSASGSSPAAPGGGATTNISGTPPLPTGAGTDLGPFSPASFSNVTVGPWILLIVGGLLLLACGTLAARRGSRAA